MRAVNVLRRGRIIGTLLGENIRATPCTVFTVCGTLAEHAGDTTFKVDPKQIHRKNN